VTFPKCLRYFLHRNPALFNRVLRIVDGLLRFHPAILGVGSRSFILAARRG
jgi:hypothetical protein